MEIEGRDGSNAGAVWDAWLHANSPRLMLYARQQTRSEHDAEDVLQECYLKLVSAPSAYQAQGKPMAYLLRIARNLCVDRLRLRQRRGEEALPETAITSNAIASAPFLRMKNSSSSATSTSVILGVITFKI